MSRAYILRLLEALSGDCRRPMLLDALKKPSNTLFKSSKPANHKDSNTMLGKRNQICSGCGHKNKKCTC